MRKSGSFETAYAALSRIESGQITDAALAELRRAINGTSSLLAAKAVEIAAAKGLRELIPDMLAAFERFMIDGARVDKQCSAKIAIVNALNEMEFAGDAVFLAGARYVQLEAAYGEPIDTAVPLRCNCAYALARIEHPEAHYVLADLLVDRENSVRAAAAKALAHMGTSEAELLLRLKLLTGENELDVLDECFAGLMAMSPDRSLSFVARYLRSDDPSVAECAALAIGNSRLSQAYDVLRGYWDDEVSPAVRRMLLLPIALVRTSEAFSFLLDVLRRADSKTAAQAISALSLYADDSSVESIREVVEARGDAEVSRRFRSEIGA